MLAQMAVRIKSVRANAVLCQVCGCESGAEYLVYEETKTDTLQEIVVTAYCSAHAENLATQNGLMWHGPISHIPSMKAESAGCEPPTTQASPRLPASSCQRVGRRGSFVRIGLLQ